MCIICKCGRSLCVVKKQVWSVHTCVQSVRVKDRQAGKQRVKEQEGESHTQQKIMFVTISIRLLQMLGETTLTFAGTAFFKMCRAQHCCLRRCVLLFPYVPKPFLETFWLIVRESAIKCSFGKVISYAVLFMSVDLPSAQKPRAPEDIYICK